MFANIVASAELNGRGSMVCLELLAASIGDHGNNEDIDSLV